MDGNKPFRQWCKDNGISPQTGYREISADRLIVVKVGARTYVTPEADKAWREALPRFQPRTAA